MKQVMNRLRIYLVVLIAGMMVAGPVFGQEKEIEDITEEVLRGPSDMNPEKILGPGGIGIMTNKNILMSFGATVRMIPTQESNWDFGMSNDVPGYFNTEPLKQFAGGSLTTANAVQGVYQSSLAFEGASSNTSVISSFDTMVSSLLTADQNTSLTQITQFAAGAVSIQEWSQNIGNTATAAYLEGYAAGGSTGGAAALDQAATQAEQTYVQLLKALEQDPDNETLKTQAAAAGGAAAGLRAAEQAVSADASTGPNSGTIAQAGTISAMADAAELVENADALASGVAVSVSGNPDATAANLTDSVAYLTALKATADSFSPYYLAKSFLKSHSNESGNVNDGYIRNETKLYFNAMPKDKKWSFYAALEYDRPINNDTVDNRGGRDSESSNFGLERLNASIELTDGLRLHTGWDIWGMDIIEAGSMVYGDDNPGFWMKGDYKSFDFSIAWLKLEDNDFQISAADQSNASDEDRDVIAGYLDYYIPGREKDKVRFFYGYDRIRDVPAMDLTGAIAAQAGLADYAGIYGNNGIKGSEADTADTDAHTIGAYYVGNFGLVNFMAEGVYKYGSADDTGLEGVDNGVSVIGYDDFDISAYAFATDVSVELKDFVGWHSLKPHIGFMYTSGDDDPDDDTLGGFTGITSAQRFSSAWGGENTIIGDSNMVLGSTLYGYIPEYHGNGTPVFTGGLQNSAGTGAGRGDNPGLSLLSMGVTLRPKIFLIYRTNVNMFWWNEDFYVGNMVDPMYVDASGLQKSRYTLVEAGYAGTEWDNEVTLALNKNMFIKGQAALFFPGDGVKDVTSALSGGTESDDIATRLAMEFIWNF